MKPGHVLGIMLIAALVVCPAVPALAGLVLKPELLAKAEAEGSVRVNILLKTPALAAGPGRIERNLALSRQTMARLDPAEVQFSGALENVPAFFASLTPAGLKQLAALESVAAISPDIQTKALTAQGVPLMNPEEFRLRHGGAGVAIAIVDTGIDYNHGALGAGGFPNTKVLGGYDFGDDDADPLDCQGHGTSVAGIAAGTDTSYGDFRGGVAPEAKLYALKIVQGCSTSAALSTISRAWDWAVSHQMDDPANPIMVINTSFGGGYFDSSCDDQDPVAAAVIEAATQAGIIIPVASGNEGFCDGLASPACFSGAVSVGAVYDAGFETGPGWCVSDLSCLANPTGGCTTGAFCRDEPLLEDSPTCFSNTAPFLDLMAPSYRAETPGLLGGYTPSFSGTSASAPYAAGAAALIQSYWRSATGQWFSVVELLARMKDNGRPIPDERTGLTFPRVDIARAATGISGVIDLENCTQDRAELVGAQVAYYRIESPLNAVKLTAAITSISDDVDLYLKYGSQPTLDDYSCRSTRGSFMDETCQVYNPQPGWWYLTVRTKEAGSGLVRLCWEVEDDFWWW